MSSQTSHPAPSADALRPRQKFALVGAAAVMAAGIAVVFPRTASRSTFTEGSTVTADITLVSSDRHDVECLADGSVNGWRCGYVDESKPWQAVEQETLRPFMTTGHQLFLIPGLFADPALDARYQADPRGLPRGERQRFTARCTLTIVGTLASFRVRWEHTAPFGDLQGSAPVARASGCRVID